MIYVLTEEYNDYDQYGEYFIHAWTVKPDANELMKHTGGCDVEHVLKGGGRTKKMENHWYYLREVS